MIFPSMIFPFGTTTFTVRGTQRGGENLHIQHGTRHAAKVDIFTSAERAEHHQQYACRKVRQRSLKCQTHRQTGGTQHRNHRGGLNAYPPQGGNQRKGDNA